MLAQEDAEQEIGREIKGTGEAEESRYGPARLTDHDRRQSGQGQRHRTGPKKPSQIAIAANSRIRAWMYQRCPKLNSKARGNGGGSVWRKICSSQRAIVTQTSGTPSRRSFFDQNRPKAALVTRRPA